MTWTHSQIVTYLVPDTMELKNKILSWWFKCMIRVQSHCSVETLLNCLVKPFRWEAKGWSSTSNFDMACWRSLSLSSALVFFWGWYEEVGWGQEKNEKTQSDDLRRFQITDFSGGPHTRSQVKHPGSPLARFINTMSKYQICLEWHSVNIYCWMSTEKCLQNVRLPYMPHM